jgi:hypothetical protein
MQHIERIRSSAEAVRNGVVISLQDNDPAIQEDELAVLINRFTAREVDRFQSRVTI